MLHLARVLIAVVAGAVVTAAGEIVSSAVVEVGC